MRAKKIFVVVAVSLICLSLSLEAAGFSGESAAVNKLLDLMLKKDALRLGEELVYGLMDLCRNEFMAALLMNPDVMDPLLFNITKYFVAVLGPVFVAIMLVSGIYLIFFSASPASRAKVKNNLPLVVAAMILVVVSPHIMNIIFYISESLTKSATNMLINNILPKNMDNPMLILLPYGEGNPVEYLMEKVRQITWYSSEASMPFLLISAFLLFSLLLVVVARYLIVSAYVIIFPLTITLYLITYTRGIGRRLMEQTLAWIFIQAVEAVVLLIMVGLISLAAASHVIEILVMFRMAALIILLAAPVFALIFLRDFLPT